MSEKGESSKGNPQESFEKAKAALESSPTPEVTWDKPAPAGPPAQARRSYQPWFLPVVGFFKSIVSDEALLAELCLEKAIEIVKFQRDQHLFGIDSFADGGGIPGGDTTFLVSASMPLAVELYKQCLEGVTVRVEDFKAAMAESAKLRQMMESKKIVVTGT